MITDIEPRALMLKDSAEEAQSTSKHKSAWCFQVIFYRGTSVSRRSNGIGVKERHPLKT